MFHRFLLTALTVLISLVAGLPAHADEHIKWPEPKFTKKMISYGDCVSRVTKAEEANEHFTGPQWNNTLSYTLFKEADGLNITATIITVVDDIALYTTTSLSCSPKKSYVEEAEVSGEKTAKGKAAKARSKRKSSEYIEKERQQMKKLHDSIKNR